MFGAPCILVVEDSMAVRRMVQMALSGLQVTAEGSGKAGLATAIRTPPALIILDDALPDIDSVAFFAALGEDERLRTVPVVLLTARPVESALAACRNTRRALEVIQLPFRKEVLAATVERLLAEPAASTDAESQVPPATPEQIKGAARALYAALRDGLSQIPGWSAELGNQQPASYFGERLLTDLVVERVLRHLAPMFRTDTTPPAGVRPVAIWAPRTRLCQLLARWLERRHGLPAIAVAEEADPVAALSRVQPQLILVDLESPGDEGQASEFVRKVRAVPSVAKVDIVVLARPRISQAGWSELGCQAVLVKPVPIRDLEAWLPTRAGASSTVRKSVTV